jgi:hypothetical protein
MNCDNPNFSREMVDIQNMKSVLRINDYLKRLFFSYNSICESLTAFIEQLYEIYNDLNFQSVDPEILESYNKLIIFLYETILGVLSDTIAGIDCIETPVIKQVEPTYLVHKIYFNYFIDDSNSMSRYLGSVSNVSICNINDQITLIRSDTPYIYVKIASNTCVNVNDFRHHLDTYIFQTKRLIGFFYKDIEYIKNAIRMLLTIISETISIQISKKYMKKWKHVVEEVGNSIKLIKTCASVNNCPFNT